MHIGFSAASHRQRWQEAVQTAADLACLRRCLGELECSITPSHLSPAFPLAPKLVRGAWLPGSGSKGAQGTPQAAAAGTPASTPPPQQSPQQQQQQQQQQQRASTPPPQQQEEEPLAWLPATAAALALRLSSLIACLLPSSNGMAAREMLAGYRYTLRPVPALLPRTSIDESAGATLADQQLQEEQQGQQASTNSLLQRLLHSRVTYGPHLDANGRQRLLMFPPFVDQVSGCCCALKVLSLQILQRSVRG